MGHAAVETAGLSGFLHVLAITEGSRTDGVGQLQVVEFGYVCGWCLLFSHPCHLKLVAAVAQVARHRSSVYQLFVADVCHRLGLAVAEDDILYAVESQQRIPKHLAGIRVSVVRVHRVYLSVVAHHGIESVLVKRPRVDMGVDAVVAGGSEQEGLALLPPGAGLEESLAHLVEFFLCLRGFQGGQLVG